MNPRQAVTRARSRTAFENDITILDAKRAPLVPIGCTRSFRVKTLPMRASTYFRASEERAFSTRRLSRDAPRGGAHARTNKPRTRKGARGKLGREAARERCSTGPRTAQAAPSRGYDLGRAAAIEAATPTAIRKDCRTAVTQAVCDRHQTGRRRGRSPKGVPGPPIGTRKDPNGMQQP